MHKLAYLSLCLLAGPCIVIQPTRNFYAAGENQKFWIRVEKTDGKDVAIEGKANGIELVGTAAEEAAE